MHWRAPGLPYGGVEGFVGWAAASIWGRGGRGLSCFVCFWCRGAQCSIYWASPGRRCLRRWALARALAGAGRGSDAGVLRVTQSLGWRALLYFRLQALRICDASQASPRVSERSPSGPVGPETNVSASRTPPKKTRVLKHNPHEDDCSHYHHSCGEAWRALRSEPGAFAVR